MSENLTQIIKQYATATPSTDAVIEMRRHRQHAVIRRRLCYGEFDRRIDQYVSKFQKKGISAGKRVLMLLKPGIEMMCAFFALIRMGAIPVLIDSGMGIRQLVRLANFSKPDFILGSPALQWWVRLKILPLQGKVIPVSRHFAKRGQSATVMHPSNEDDIAAILFTSGSTGPAKGVVYCVKHFAAQLRKLRASLRLMQNARDVTLLPAFMLFNPMFGRTTIIPDIDYTKLATLHLPSVIETIANSAATSSFGAPVLWEKIADYCLENELKLRSLEQIFLAGVSATPRVLEKIRQAAPNAKIYTPYGATECLPICLIEATNILEELRPYQENGAGTCLGYPIEGVSVKIIAPVDEPLTAIEERHILPTGFIGEIIVSGENVTEAYDQLPEATQLAKINDNGKLWHRMGDLGFLDEKGRLWFCGRKSERVVSGSEEYFPDCIEPLFCKYSKVARAALIRYESKGIVVPALVILPKEGYYPHFFWQRWAFRRHLKQLAQQFPKTESIEHFFFLKKLPVDPRHNAKINRQQLSATFSA